MRKVFFLGCNYDQIPYLLAARQLGFRTVATDLNSAAPGAELADSFHTVGYNDLAGLIHVAEKENWSPDDRIFTAAAHFAYEGASALAKTMGLPFIKPKLADICLDKTKFYQLLADHGVNVPPFRLVSSNKISEVGSMVDKDKTYYLKSDYGKTPNYCYRITNGRIPELPKQFDAYYRNMFLLQKEVIGTHYRLNIYDDQICIFYKLTDTAAVPVRYLGPGQKEIVEKLRKVCTELGLDHFLTKFDVIMHENKSYVIDLGLDPPMRLKLLCDHLGLDFPSSYTRYYLLNDPSGMPQWSEVCKPIVIFAKPGKRFSYLDLE